jgi:hypothetical protein
MYTSVEHTMLMAVNASSGGTEHLDTREHLEDGLMNFFKAVDNDSDELARIQERIYIKDMLQMSLQRV